MMINVPTKKLVDMGSANKKMHMTLPALVSFGIIFRYISRCFHRVLLCRSGRGQGHVILVR
jgi:hypothetical protein